MLSNLNVKRTTMTWAAATLAVTVLCAAEMAGPRFLPDDPLTVDADTTLDAGGAKRDELGAWADFVVNTFMSPADRRNIPAMNVNTLGEVPDSSWFTNRIGTGSMTLDDIVRGPDRVERLDVKDWVIVAGKNAGHQAGFRAVSASDPGRLLYQIEFDPVSNPEMATGAEIIGTAIYHALGYNVVETYLIELDPARLTIAPSATIEEAGQTRAFTRLDLDAILRRAAKKADGRYRATASPFADGRNLGPFRYYGTRPDDPNDIYPHEHRRELRGNRVFTAWLNHDDSRAGNTLDMLVGPEGRQHVKHYMFDFGSMLGSGTSEQDHPWVGREYVVEPRPALLTLATFGVWRRPFIGADVPSGLRAAGNFTADGFVPDKWKPHYPNPAFRNMQPGDALWAAQILSAVSPEAIQRIVEKARFTDARVVDHMTGTLMRRRALALRSWLVAQNPVSNVRIDTAAWLRFDNPAVDAGVTGPPEQYELSWFRFDNVSGTRSYVIEGERRGESSGPVPVRNLEGAEYAGVEIRTIQREYPNWRAPVRVYFRSMHDGWRTVAVERRANASAEPRLPSDRRMEARHGSRSER